MTLDAGSQTIARITRRLIPFLCLLFIVNYLDRTNVAMAKLRLSSDLQLDDAAYGWGTGLFFIGYFLFEVPSNLILRKVGARIWIARIMITWGFLSAAMMFTRGPASFALLRFILGVAEAGFFPGILLYLTYWIPARKRARILALFLTSTAVSGLIGNPLGGALMKLNGIAHLHGWQWLFLIEGIPPILLGIGILMFPLLPDSPAQADWLTPTQRQWISDELSRDDSHAQISHVSDLFAAARDSRLWLLSLIYFMLIMGLYGFIYWLPTMVKSMTGVSDAKVGLLSAIPYAVAVIGMVLIGRHADRVGGRRRHVAVCAAVGAIGILLLIPFATKSPHPVAGLISLCVAALGIFATLGPFWTIPTRYLRGAAAAGGIAIINSTGALAGFVAPTIMGWAKSTRGSLAIGLLVVAVSLVLGAIFVLQVPHTADGRE
jgi:MFS transporter, ACS family, tartrate transporter